jgi:arginyl-tRNA synthetase|tara:strand:+ start:146 stop:1918 length:1773 start_codon:yes stop_codon:yes gene_type:complete
VEKTIQNKIKEAIKSLYNHDISINQIQVQRTRKEFDGDFTVVVFPFLKISKKKPEETADDIGKWIVDNLLEINSFNVIKGFLNLSYSQGFWLNWFQQLNEPTKRLNNLVEPKNLMVEYSSPNTNKPLHLGHIRNNLLGYSVSEILKALGHTVYKTQIVNDRGIHICKSMLAWQLYGNGETPESTGVKGDKFVGKYYVAFDKHYKKEILELVANGKTEDEAKKEAPILVAAQKMLQKWEAKDKEVMGLWETMNGWVYKGFDITYKNLGVDFDKLYYESVTYIYGKQKVIEGLKNGVFYQKEDSSIWCDLTEFKLDHKLLLRSDGTSVYMTQDIGTALMRLEDYPQLNQLIYTVGNEQDYHFQVLFAILRKLGYEWASNCCHLSYGMVDLPSGKMKSREGTVVDADDLIHDMYLKAKETTKDLGKLEDVVEEEREDLFHDIGLAGLKYFILKVDPKKQMMFNPEESIDFNGNTGPFIQYTHARISAILKRAKSLNFNYNSDVELHAKELEVMRQLYFFSSMMQDAAQNYSPAEVSNYLYDLVKIYNSFYQSVKIFDDENVEKIALRIELSKKVGETIAFCLNLLGIAAPSQM